MVNTEPHNELAFITNTKMNDKKITFILAVGISIIFLKQRVSDGVPNVKITNCHIHQEEGKTAEISNLIIFTYYFLGYTFYIIRSISISTIHNTCYISKITLASNRIEE